MDIQSTNANGAQVFSPVQLFAAMLNGHHELAQQLVSLYNKQLERFFKNTAFYSSDKTDKGINQMKNASFWRKLIEELLADKEYSVTRIAEELDMPREVIADLQTCSMNHESSFSLGIQLLELHCKMRSDLHQ